MAANDLVRGDGDLAEVGKDDLRAERAHLRKQLHPHLTKFEQAAEAKRSLRDDAGHRGPRWQQRP
eukprot:6208962-Pleurochrysis_carterae.AAC.1